MGPAMHIGMPATKPKPATEVSIPTRSTATARDGAALADALGVGVGTGIADATVRELPPELLELDVGPAALAGGVHAGFIASTFASCSASVIALARWSSERGT